MNTFMDLTNSYLSRSCLMWGSHYDRKKSNLPHSVTLFWDTFVWTEMKLPAKILFKKIFIFISYLRSFSNCIISCQSTKFTRTNWLQSLPPIAAIETETFDIQVNNFNGLARNEKTNIDEMSVIILILRQPVQQSVWTWSLPRRSAMLSWVHSYI